MSHHPSCKQTDKALVWLCEQCGEVESAEAEVRERERAARLAEHKACCVVCEDDVLRCPRRAELEAQQGKEPTDGE